MVIQLTNEPYDALAVTATSVLGIEMFDFQIEVLRCIQHYPRVACVASRQIGKSVSITILALTFSLCKPDQTVLIVSTGERQVKELLTKRNYSIKKVFKRAGRDSLLLPNVCQKSLIKNVANEAGLKVEFKVIRDNAEEIEFPNGSRIIVVPSNPDTVAGFTADLLIGDEVAKMPNWNEIQAATFPFVARTGGKIALFSSYKGKNHWYDITQDKMSPENPKGWCVLKYPVSVNPPPDLDQLKHDFPLDVYMEEFECIPMDEAHSLFPYSLIEACSNGNFAEWI